MAAIAEVRIAVVEAHPVAVHGAHHADHVFHFVGAAEAVVRHVPAGRVAHLEILQMQRRIRKEIEIADVVIVQMRDDYVLHL